MLSCRVGLLARENLGIKGGENLAQKIKGQVRQVKSDLTQEKEASS